MATKAETSLITAILIEDRLHPHTKHFAGLLAELRPEAKFSLVKGSEKSKPQRLLVRYKTQTKLSKIQVNIGFTIECDYSTIKKTDLTLELRPASCSVVGGGRYGFTMNSNGDRMRNWEIKNQHKAYQELDDIDFDLQFLPFEGSLIREAVFADTNAKRRATNKATKQSKHEQETSDLRFRLETQHGLIGNERAVRLFDYLYRHNGGNLKGLEKQFNEMAFIVK